MKKYSIGIAVMAIVLMAASCGQKQVKETVNKVENETSNSINQTTSTAETVNPKVVPGTLTVTQTVQGSGKNRSFNSFTEGQTALDILKIDHQITTKNFAGVGEFVESIDGVKPDAKHFWALYVNGQSSNVGASDYKVKDKDRIEWKLEEIK